MYAGESVRHQVHSARAARDVWVGHYRRGVQGPDRYFLRDPVGGAVQRRVRQHRPEAVVREQVGREDLDGAIGVDHRGGSFDASPRPGDHLRPPGGGAVDGPVEVEAVAGAFGGDVDAVLVDDLGRGGVGGAGPGDGFWGPVGGETGSPVEVEAVAGTLGRDDGGGAVGLDGRLGEGGGDAGDQLAVPAGGVDGLPVDVEAVEGALGGNHDVVADHSDGGGGEGGAVRRDLLAVPVIGAVLVPVEPQSVAVRLHRYDRVAGGDRHGRPHKREGPRGPARRDEGNGGEDDGGARDNERPDWLPALSLEHAGTPLPSATWLNVQGSSARAPYVGAHIAAHMAGGHLGRRRGPALPGHPTPCPKSWWTCTWPSWPRTLGT